MQLIRTALVPVLVAIFSLAGLIFHPVPCPAVGLELTPILGYSSGGDFEDSQNGNALHFAETESYGLILDIPEGLREGAFYELLYLRQPTHLRQEPLFAGTGRFDVDIDYLHLGGSYGEVLGAVHPYAVGGIGLTHMRPEQGESETRFSFSLGGGIKLPVTERLGLRFEGRAFGTLFNGQSAIFCQDNACAIRVSGDLMWQFTAFTGVVFRF